MSEPEQDGLSIEQRLARAVTDVPGVAALEPSLERAIRRLTQRVSSPDEPEGQPPEQSPDGVTVTSNADAVDVAVEISVTGPGAALDTAVAVRKAVLAELSLAAFGRGAVSVRVLSVDPSDAGATESDGHDAVSSHRRAARA